MDWKEQLLLMPLWTRTEVIDLLCGYEPDKARPNDVEKKAAEENIRRAIKAELLHPIGKTPDDTDFKMYGSGEDLDPLEVVSWVEERMVSSKFPFTMKDFEEAVQSDAHENKLNQSNYWKNFKKMTSDVVKQYPSWRQENPKANKTEVLPEWIKTFGADYREAEVIKKILSDLFPNLY